MCAPEPKLFLSRNSTGSASCMYVTGVDDTPESAALTVFGGEGGGARSQRCLVRLLTVARSGFLRMALSHSFPHVVVTCGTPGSLSSY